MRWYLGKTRVLNANCEVNPESEWTNLVICQSRFLEFDRSEMISCVKPGYCIPICVANQTRHNTESTNKKDRKIGVR